MKRILSSKLFPFSCVSHSAFFIYVWLQCKSDSQSYFENAGLLDLSLQEYIVSDWGLYACYSNFLKKANESLAEIQPIHSTRWDFTTTTWLNVLLIKKWQSLKVRCTTVLESNCSSFCTKQNKTKEENKKKNHVKSLILPCGEVKREEMQTSDQLFNIQLQTSLFFFFTLLDFP